MRCCQGACLEDLSKNFRNSKLVDLWPRICTRKLVVVVIVVVVVVVVEVYKLEYRILLGNPVIRLLLLLACLMGATGN